MNYAGCKRKFDISAYCKYVDRAVKEEHARRKAAPAVPTGLSTVGGSGAGEGSGGEKRTRDVEAADVAKKAKK